MIWFSDANFGFETCDNHMFVKNMSSDNHLIIETYDYHMTLTSYD